MPVNIHKNETRPIAKFNDPLRSRYESGERYTIVENIEAQPTIVQNSPNCGRIKNMNRMPAAQMAQSVALNVNVFAGEPIIVLAGPCFDCFLHLYYRPIDLLLSITF